jgi:hypothetical protein
MRSRNLLAILRLSGGSRHRRGVQRRVEVGNYPAARPMDGARPLSFLRPDHNRIIWRH